MGLDGTTTTILKSWEGGGNYSPPASYASALYIAMTIVSLSGMASFIIHYQYVSLL